jgi:hypothetical protein
MFIKMVHKSKFRNHPYFKGVNNYRNTKRDRIFSYFSEKEQKQYILMSLFMYVYVYTEIRKIQAIQDYAFGVFINNSTKRIVYNLFDFEPLLLPEGKPHLNLN